MPAFATALKTTGSGRWSIHWSSRTSTACSRGRPSRICAAFSMRSTGGSSTASTSPVEAPREPPTKLRPSPNHGRPADRIRRSATKRTASATIPFFRAAGLRIRAVHRRVRNLGQDDSSARSAARRFAGPDTDGKVDTWVLEFARRTKGDAVLLTSHYYGMGPASDPGMTAERLLRKDQSRARRADCRGGRSAPGGWRHAVPHGRRQLLLRRRQKESERRVRVCAVGGGLHSQGCVRRLCGRQSAWRRSGGLHADRELRDRAGRRPGRCTTACNSPRCLRAGASRRARSKRAQTSPRIKAKQTGKDACWRS